MFGFKYIFFYLTLLRIKKKRDLEEQGASKRSLFNQALRSIKPRGKQDKIDYCKKRPQSRLFTPRKKSGPAQI